MALGEQIFIDGPSGNFDANEDSTIGCEDISDAALCDEYFPYSDSA
ncbi:MAG: hypothetical protein AAF384_16300 [Pseudomonadota bacterium]